MRLRVGVGIASALLMLSLHASAQMSDNEKKSAARAAYTEGAELQEKGKWAEALADFEKAQKLYDAPTHLLHIAQCQAQLGHLVEASETYETLSHKTLEKGAPDAFKQAQDQGNKDLEALKPRIPTLRVSVKPDPKELKELQVNLNDKQMPVEMVGIARPINPGAYKITASATGYGTKEATTINVAEKESKSVDVTLEKGVVVAGSKDDTGMKPAPVDMTGPSPTGLLIGLRPLAFLPLGNVDNKTKFSDYAGFGFGAGIDVMGRVVKSVLVGGTLEGAIMTAPDSFTPSDPSVLANVANNRASIAVKTEYLGIDVGYMLDVDKVTPIAWLRGGYRYIQRSVEIEATKVRLDDNVNGLEGGIRAGVSIPAGPMRIVPLLNFDGGQMSARDCVTADKFNVGGATPGSVSSTCTAPDGGIFFMVGLSVGVFYHLDFGRPKQVSAREIKNLTHFRF